MEILVKKYNKCHQAEFGKLSPFLKGHSKKEPIVINDLANRLRLPPDKLVAVATRLAGAQLVRVYPPVEPNAGARTNQKPIIDAHRSAHPGLVSTGVES